LLLTVPVQSPGQNLSLGTGVTVTATPRTAPERALDATGYDAPFTDVHVSYAAPVPSPVQHVPLGARGRVTPTPPTAPERAPYTTGYSAIFWVKNTGTESDTYTLSCNGSSNVDGVSCPLFASLSPGDSTDVLVTYNVGVQGVGSVQLTAEGNFGVGSGTQTVPVGHTLHVTPHGAVDLTRRANAGETYSASFTVRNADKAQRTYSLSCTASGTVTCGTVTPTSLPLAVGASGSVTVSYSVAAAGTGTLSLTAANGDITDVGSYTIPVASPGGPLVDFGPYNYAKQDYSLCASSCFATIYAQTTVPYFSLDTPRSATLVYNSDRVNPRPFVHVEVTPDTGYTPTEYRLQVKVNGAFVTFVNGDQTLRFAYPGRTKVRLGGQFDASGYTTGVYPLDILVSAYDAGSQSSITTSLATKLVVVNETSSAIAAGWTLGGIQMLYLQSDSSALVTEGDGNAVYFTKVGASWVSPAGDFSLFGRSVVGGTTFARTYPDRSQALFDNTGKMVQLRDRFSNVTTIVYDGSSRVSQIRDPANLALTLGYGANGLASIQDPATPVRTTNITVDASRKLTTIADPDNVSTTFVIDGNLQLSKVIDRRGDTTTFAYDGLSRKLTSTTYPKVPIFGAGTVSPTTSDSPWQHVGVPYSSTATTPATPAGADTVRARVTDARGYVTVLQVDRFGAVTRIDDALSRTTRYTHDGESRIVRDSVPSGHIVRRTWSGPNLVQLWDSTTGRTINEVYESTWNQVTQVFGDADSVWNYWSVGKLDSTRVGKAAQPAGKFTYDGRGRMLTATDPGGHQMSRVYDTGNNWMNTASETVVGGATSVAYDGVGRDTATTDPFGRRTRFQYDALNRTTRTIGAVADTTLLTYDSLFLRQARDPIGQVYQFTHNALGWLVARTDPGSRQDQYQYDQNGNVRQWINRRAQTISWAAYDALNRPTAVTADGKTTSFSYDLQDRFTAASNPESTDSLKLDAAGHPVYQVSVRAGTRYELQSAYNIRDLRTALQINVPWADTISYHYNAYMRLDTLTDLAGGRTPIHYDNDLLPDTMSLPNSLGVVGQYPAPHSTGQLTFTDGAVNNTIGVLYNYNSLGLVAERYNVQFNHGREFRYDPANRDSAYLDFTTSCDVDTWDSIHGHGCSVPLTKTYQSNQEFYSYDKVGNRTDRGATPADPGNRLRYFDGYNVDYDADGNVIRKYKSDLSFDQYLYWSARGQLDSVKTNGAMVRFGYDGLGRRVRTSTSTATTRYLYDGHDLFAEVDGGGNRLAEYTYYPGVDQPHSLRRRGAADSVFYYAQDVTGNVVGLVNGARVLVNQYKYKPFGGDDGSPANPVPNTLGFAARQLDSETGLYYLRARYYDPQLGRFVSEDPLGLAAGINQYAYAGNDPVNYSDPSGEFCKRDVTARQGQLSAPMGAEADVIPENESAQSAGTTAIDCGGGGAPHCIAQISGYQDDAGNWFLDPEGMFPGFNVDMITCYGGGLLPAISAAASPAASKSQQGPSCPLALPPEVQGAGNNAYFRSEATNAEQTNGVFPNGSWIEVPMISSNQFVGSYLFPVGATAMVHGHLKLGPWDTTYGSVSRTDLRNASRRGVPYYAFSVDSVSVALPNGSHITCAR